VILLYSVLHVASGFLLAAATFSALAAPTPQRRRSLTILTGVLSLLMLTGGFGLMARYDYAFAPWLYVKIACWIALSALSGLAFRRPRLAPRLALLGALVILTAVWSVYFKPGMTGLAS
jgi:uncharacterized membrane protein SirB2